eukprot:TRINITY_DN277_c0_g1_i2.p1 TRINITY_DN277_c0_g1~~TRINITY_DN277_c0_g1_i2.p1  ORF type:complete len:1714 (-),score=424.19 TRINITY_DN277_c0_g1_i2:21538-26679(-)
MNLRIKRCWSGLMAWAALTGIAVAQTPNEPEGSVKLGQVPTIQTTPEADEGTVRLGQGPAADPGPLTQMSSPGAGYGSYFPLQSVDRRFQPRFNVDSRGGGLYGYTGGFTTIGAFVPFAIDSDEAIFFVDGRGLITYDNQGGGANVGAGWRWWMREFDSVVGLSTWYDNSSGGIGSNFNQIGLSFEYLSRYVDYRINGYIPVGEKDRIGSSSLASTASCMGNNIVFQRTTQTAQAYTGFDIETGGPLPLIGRYGVNGYIGGYHFMGAGQAGGSFTGVSGRFLSQINEDVSFGMQVTSDHTFGLNTQFQVFVTLPDGMPSRWMRNPTVQDRMTQSVFRQFRAITHIDEVKSYEAAINPLTNKPYFVAFINPNLTTGGSGTDENPFNSIAQYNSLTAPQRAAYDVILVNGRIDGTSTNLDTGLGTAAPALGLQLSDNQHLWGANIVHDFVTPNGTFQFQCSDASATPILVNQQATGGNVITVANNNEVSGFTINGATPLGVQNYGIVSQAGGITNGFNINNNNFINNIAAVQLTHSGSAVGRLVNNTVTGGPATGSAIGFQSNAGFEVTQTAGTLGLLVQNNTISGVKGEDANGNGVLDPGEDTNGNLTLDMGIGMNFVATGATAVIDANDPTSTTNPLGILSNNVSGSGAGIELQALAGGQVNAAVQGNTLSNNVTDSSVVPTAGFGFKAIADGAGSVMSIATYTDNQTNDNEGDGAVLTASNGGALQVLGDIVGPQSGSTAAGDTFSGNNGDGLRVEADNGTVLLTSITNTSFDTNGENGLNLVATNAGQIQITDPLAGNTFTDNGLNGLLVNAQNGTIDIDLNSTTSPNTFTTNGGDGLLFQTATGGLINTDLAGITSTGNTKDGIGFFLDGGVINVTNIQSNVATGNLQDGLSIVNSNGGIFNTNLIGGLTPALGNDFSNNTRAGLFFGGVTPPTPLSFNNIVQIANNNFNRNTAGTDGILFDTTNVQTSNSGAQTLLTQNTFVGGANTSDRGVGGTVNGGGVLFAFGDNRLSNTNTFTSNKDADIGLILKGDSINVITIDNHDLSNVVNGTNAIFNGEGVAFILEDTASLTGYIQRSTINNNATDGIRIDVSGTALPTDFASVNDFVIGGITSNLGNTIQGNGTNGIEVNRTTNGEVNNMQILNNTIQTNGTNGIRLVASNQPNQDTYTINENLITANGFDGIQLRVEADASINSIIDHNTITNNGTAGNPIFGSGIHTLEQANSANDGRFVAGLWTRNTITGNNLDGIELDSSMTTLVIGDPVDTNLGNFISANRRNGINVEGPTGTGEVVIGSNVISQNGTAGTVGTAAETAGIMANVRPVSNVTIINNQIVNNLGDGIQYGIDRNFIGSGQIQIIGNNVAFNDGRGLDILNLGDDFIQVTVDSNVFNRNLLEGVYVVNTSSRTQNQFDASTVDLARDGSVFRSPTIEMQFSNNQVIGNGFGTSNYLSGPASATGLVVRVGTSGATSNFLGASDPGGFASTGAAIPVGGSPFGTSTFRGGVTMTVDNNQFSGNFGDDLMFASFVSTVDPSSGTAWDPLAAPPVYNPNGYQSDPLARLDLYFRNNTYDVQGVASGINNYDGITGANGHVVNQSTVAYYDNADALFKSRSNNINTFDPTTSGPFPDADRRRNAQRQASRTVLGFTNPTSPVGASFLYPGLGESTFRVSSDSDTTDFLLDNEPVTDSGDWNGYNFINNNRYGEAPFGWGSF